MPEEKETTRQWTGSPPSCILRSSLSITFLSASYFPSYLLLSLLLITSCCLIFSFYMSSCPSLSFLSLLLPVLSITYFAIYYFLSCHFLSFPTLTCREHQHCWLPMKRVELTSLMDWDEEGPPPPPKRKPSWKLFIDQNTLQFSDDLIFLKRLSRIILQAWNSSCLCFFQFLPMTHPLISFSITSLCRFGV